MVHVDATVAGFTLNLTRFAVSVITDGTNGIMEKERVHPFVNVTVYKSWSLGEIYPTRRSTLPGEYKSAKLEWYSETGLWCLCI